MLETSIIVLFILLTLVIILLSTWMGKQLFDLPPLRWPRDSAPVLGVGFVQAQHDPESPFAGGRDG